MYQIFLEVPETHRNISRPFGEVVDAPVGRVPHTQTLGQVEQINMGGEVNISASIRAPYTKCCLEVPETHRNISRPLGRC